MLGFSFSALFAEQDLIDYDIIYPALISEDGEFISHGVHEEHVNRIRRSLGDPGQANSSSERPLLYKLAMNSKEIHLNLTINRNLVSQGFVIERQSGPIVHHTSSCLYQGRIQGQIESIVAINNCEGLVSSFSLLLSYLLFSSMLLQELCHENSLCEIGVVWKRRVKVATGNMT